MNKIEKIEGWVARDDDDTLAIHYEKPRRVCYHKNDIFSDGTPWAWENEAGYGLLPVKTFPDLKWEDEPIEVELTIKRVSTLSEEPDKSLEVDLSIHDLELLHTFLYAVKNNKQGAFTFTRLSDEQYQEVLRRFKNAK